MSSIPLPSEPRRGDPVTADWARRVAAALRSLRLRGGPGVRVTTGPDGTTVSAAPGRGRGGADGVAVCEITRVDGNGRVVAAYGTVRTLAGARLAGGGAIVPVCGLLDGNGADVGYAALGFRYAPLVAESNAMIIEEED